MLPHCPAAPDPSKWRRTLNHQTRSSRCSRSRWRGRPARTFPIGSVASCGISGRQSRSLPDLWWRPSVPAVRGLVRWKEYYGDSDWPPPSHNEPQPPPRVGLRFRRGSSCPRIPPSPQGRRVLYIIVFSTRDNIINKLQWQVPVTWTLPLNYLTWNTIWYIKNLPFFNRNVSRNRAMKKVNVPTMKTSSLETEM